MKRRSLVVLAACAALFADPASAFERVDDFGDDPGDLVVYEHVPAGAEGPMPLVLLLHGCSQDADGYERASGWRALADEHGFALVSAEQPTSNNVGRCFNWFEPADSERDRGEAASLASAVEHMLASHDVDPARVLVTGASAGGAMAAVMLASYPELFAAGAVVAGGPYRCASNAAEAFSCMSGSVSASPEEWGDRVRAASEHDGPWPRVAIWHGDADTTVSPVNAAALEAQWLDVHGIDPGDAVVETRGDAELRTFPGAQDGLPVVERWTIAGLGHAIAVDPDEGCGALEPFFADVDLCSSAHIARFFGLVDESDVEPGDAGPADDELAPGCACATTSVSGAPALFGALLLVALGYSTMPCRNQRRRRRS